MIHNIFLIRKPGETLYWRKVSNESISKGLNVMLVAGVLQAVNTFSEEVFNESVSKISFEDYDVLVFRIVDKYISVFMVDRNDINGITKAADIATKINLALRNDESWDEEKVKTVVDEIINSKFSPAPSQLSLGSLIQDIKELVNLLEASGEIQIGRPVTEANNEVSNLYQEE
ncbi:MAG: hypothetical protein ACP6IS_02015 [Candidatus Asgardarchaeia archaeon]